MRGLDAFGQKSYILFADFLLYERTFLKVLIWGFSSLEEIDRAIQPLIPDKIGYLFYVLTLHRVGIVAKWAEWRGAPVLSLEHMFDSLNGDKKLEYIANEADYILFKKREEDMAGKRVLMMMKGMEKHGTIVE